MKHQIEFEPNISNFLDESFSNLKGKFKAKRKAKKDLKSVCGRRPLSKKKRGDYDKCVAEYKVNDGGAESVSKTDDVSESTTDVSTTTETKKDTIVTPTTETTPTTDTKDKGTTPTTTSDDSGKGKGSDNKGTGTGDTEQKKILGMKPMVAYGVFALVAIGGGLLIWQMTKGKVVVPATV